MSEASLPALKERAGVVAALVDGSQTVLLRDPALEPQEYKGWFALYPAYSHQSVDRYATGHLDYYRENAEKPDEGIPIRAVARLVEEWSLEGTAVDALANYCVYSYAGLRDKYGIEDGDAVRVLLLRVAELPETRVLDERPAYRGCRTWIDLDESIEFHPEQATPVIDAKAFAARWAGVAAALS